VTERKELGERKEEIFEYENSQCLVNWKQDTTIDGKNKQIIIKRLMFDEQKRLVKTIYFNDSGQGLLFSRFYYDDNSNIIQFENYSGSKLKDKYIQTYDSIGRKKIRQSIDMDGNFTYRTIYTWENIDSLILEMYDIGGNLIIKNKEIYIRDKNGNIIKKYFYDLVNKISIVMEYEIDYY
jgi:hypothetical protein